MPSYGDNKFVCTVFQNVHVLVRFLKNDTILLLSRMHNSMIKEKWGWFSSLYIRLHLTSCHEICIFSVSDYRRKKRLCYKIPPCFFFFFFQVGKKSTQNKNIYNWEGGKHQILQYYFTKHLYCTVKTIKRKWDDPYW